VGKTWSHIAIGDKFVNIVEMPHLASILHGFLRSTNGVCRDLMSILRLECFSMKILLATLLVSLGQTTLAQDQVVKELAGCYELRVERSKYLFENDGHQFLPKGIELTAERGALGRFTVRGFDSETRSDLPLSSWRVKDDGSVELGVGTGFVGWNFQFKRSGSDLRGTARFWTDTDSEIAPDSGLGPFQTVAHKLSCDDAPAYHSDSGVEANGRISGTFEHHSPESDWAGLKVIVLAYPNPDWRHPVRETWLEPDASRFEIGSLPAGQYVLGAYVVQKVGTPDRHSLAYWGWTYFPGVYDPKLAQPIQIVEGKSVSNVKLKMMY
jgi:hypothetical protein